jgi:hypothetical protein
MTLNSRLSWGTQLAQTIVNATNQLQGEKPALFIQGIDFLLAAAAAEEINANEILTLLSSLSEVNSLFSSMLIG